MSFEDLFVGCVLGWMGFVLLFGIFVWPRVEKKFDKEDRLRRKVEIDNDPLATPSKKVTRTP
jgi:hypothetical protein